MQNCKNDIPKIIQNLDHDQISIRILKLCSFSISDPLEIIFNQWLETGTSPNDWKKGYSRCSRGSRLQKR